MYAAMECRGFSGTYRVAVRSGLSARDYVFIIANVLILSVFFFLQGA